MKKIRKICWNSQNINHSISSKILFTICIKLHREQFSFWLLKAILGIRFTPLLLIFFISTHSSIHLSTNFLENGNKNEFSIFQFFNLFHLKNPPNFSQIYQNIHTNYNNPIAITILITVIILKTIIVIIDRSFNKIDLRLPTKVLWVWPTDFVIWPTDFV